MAQPTAALPSNRPPSAGDRLPPLRLAGAGGEPVSPLDDAYVGRPCLLMLCTTGTANEPVRLFRSALRQHPDATLFVIAPEIPSDPVEGAVPLRDPKSKLAAVFGLGGQPLATIIMDANYRIAAVLDQPDPQAQADAAAATLDELAAESRPHTGHAPILILPRVLSPGDCTRLIGLWRQPAPEFQSDGFTSEGFSEAAENFKIHVHGHGELVQMVVREKALTQWLDGLVAPRVKAELEKAFQTTITNREDYRIVGYDAAKSGHLGLHRDNPTPQTRHRRFTVVVTLDGDGFEGGGLRFPEYGGQSYRVPTGAAIVWSAALLHGVEPVTAGQRFVLGTHLFGPQPKSATPG